MKKLTVQEADILAGKFRSQVGLSPNDPINIKTLVRKHQITAMYRPLSVDSYGISCKSNSGKMFILINCNSTRGRQHFTVAHELYHLYFDKKPTPHMCGVVSTIEEKNADLFASSLLLPKEGIYAMISNEEILSHKINLATILRIEQMFQVSRSTLLIRLKNIGIISEGQLKELQSIPVIESAREYGYDSSLYRNGNKGLFIGDFGEKARILFESERISEGHYMELLNMISDEREEN